MVRTSCSILLQALQYISPVQMKTWPQITTHTPVQPYHTDTKYNILLILIQVHFLGEESHSPKTPLLKLCASEFPGEENHQASKGKGGLALGWPPALGMVRCPLVA